jgi:hypothetical protein
MVIIYLLKKIVNAFEAGILESSNYFRYGCLDCSKSRTTYKTRNKILVINRKYILEQEDQRQQGDVKLSPNNYRAIRYADVLMAAEAHNKVQRQMMQQHEYLNEVRADFFWR